ncbi:MAG: ATP-dependent zinc metalloprotease FtsH [Eubacterium sp.]|nr:ATP-dependent zinc metalloprotease FtsH [Eubacterium sp.]
MAGFNQNSNNNQPDNGRRGNGQDGPDGKLPIAGIIIACLVLSMILMSVLSGVASGGPKQKITYDQFVDMVKNEKVSEVELQGNTLTIIEKKTGAKYQTTLIGDGNGLNELLMDKDITYSEKDVSAAAEIMSTIMSIVIPLAVFLIGMRFLMRNMGGGAGGIMGVGKSKARNYMQAQTGVTFADVAGEDEAKDSLKEVVEFLHNPQRYVEIGAKLPKGALLVGPPGTGKTLLAKAVAGEAGVPFFSLSGSEFVEMFVGVGASRVRDLFGEAKKAAPCIIFIDEIDAIGKSRDSVYGGGNDEREQTLNQLLAEMDGFDSSKGILILAATNRPEVLDPALLRPGRFDRRVIVDRPDLKGRIAILKVHAKEVRMDESVDFRKVALATSGAVGSDLANMINESAILAVNRGRKYVTQKDLMDAVEVVLVGREKKDRILTEKEKDIVAYHETGHALVMSLLKDAEPVQKITIVPRTKGALGYTMQTPEEEKYLNSKSELINMIKGLLGGRAAEDLVFGDVTTGASNDIERATALVRAMITQYGMSDKFGLMVTAKEDSQYLSQRVRMDCGDATATEIDHEVSKVLKQCYEEAKKILEENRDALDRLAGYLKVQETITGQEFMRILHTVQEERLHPVDEKAVLDCIQSEQTDKNAENNTAAVPAGEDIPAEQAGENRTEENLEEGSGTDSGIPEDLKPGDDTVGEE